MSHLVSPYATYDFKGKPQNPLYGPKYVVGCYGCLRTSGPSLYDKMSPYNECMKTRKQQIFNSGHLILPQNLHVHFFFNSISRRQIPLNCSTKGLQNGEKCEGESSSLHPVAVGVTTHCWQGLVIFKMPLVIH